MRFRNLAVLAIVGACVYCLCRLSTVVADEHEAVCGKSTEFWIGELQGKDTERRFTALEALALHGRRAAPAIPHLIRLLDDRNPRTSGAAAKAIGDIGLSAEMTIPALIRKLGSDGVPLINVGHTSSYAGALARLGHASVPELTRALESPSDAVREEAVYVLGAIGPDAKDSVSALVRILEDVKGRGNTLGMRTLVAIALGRIGHSTKEAVHALGELLRKRATFCVEDDDLYDEFAPYFVLALTKLEAPPVEEFLQSLQDRDSERIEVLSMVGPAGRRGVPMLSKLLDDKELGRFAAEALGWIGPAASDAIPSLVRSLASPLQSVELIANAIGSVGVEARVAAPALRSELLANRTHCREDRDLIGVIRALSDIESDSDATILSFINLFDDIKKNSSMYPFQVDKSQVQLELCKILGRTGAAGGAAVPALAGLLDRRDEVARAAVVALGRIGPKAHGAVPALIKLLDDGHLRHVSATSLGRIGPPARSAVPALQSKLNDAPHFDLLISQAMIRIDPNSRAAVQAICRKFSKSTCEYECVFISVLLGDDHPGIEVLVKRDLEHLNWMLSPEARYISNRSSWLDIAEEYLVGPETGLTSIEDFGPSASKAVPYLKTLRDFPNIHIRRWVDRTLKRIDIGGETPDHTP